MRKDAHEVPHSAVCRVIRGARHGRRLARAALAASIVLASVAACASGGAAGGGGGAEVAAAGAKCSYGCMVPGARLAGAFGISAVDTLPELNPRATLRATLDNGIRQHVQQNNWSTENNCQRKFGGPDLYVVIFHRYCDPSMGADSDPRMVVAFTSNGQVRGEVSWTGPATVGMLRPERRY